MIAAVPERHLKGMLPYFVQSKKLAALKAKQKNPSTN
jgi:hypothetical protein